MPRRDGTGPIGQAENCMNISGQGMQWRNGCGNREMGNYGRHGFGRGVCRKNNSFPYDKSMLVKQKEFLQKELDVVNKQLDNL